MIRSILFTAALALGACSWSSFDDLADSTWVDSSGAAEGVDPNRYLGIAVPGETGRNAVFVALGSNTDSVSSFSYDPDGARAAVGVDIRGDATQFGILPPEAVIAGDPYANVVGVAATTGETNDADTKVVHFQADDVDVIVEQNDFNSNGGPLDGPIMPTGMAYARTNDDDPGDTGTTTTDVVLARERQLAMVLDYAADAHTLIGCQPDSTGAEIVRNVAAGQFDAAPDDEIVMVTTDEQGTTPSIVILDGRTVLDAWMANGQTLGPCFDGVGRNPIARLTAPAGDARIGDELVIADLDGDGDDDIALSSAPEANQVTVYLTADPLSATTGAAIEPPPDASGFGDALAAGELDVDAGGAELVVGAPKSDMGATSSGAAYVYTFEGGEPERVLVVHDAQPEAQQEFGSAVAVVPWGGATNVLVVTTKTEVFTYFRTSLYDDVRQ